MNRILEDIIFEMNKADALMFAIEGSYLEFDILPEEKERYDRSVFSFYAVWDIIKSVQKHLDELTADQKIVDAITAMSEAKNQHLDK